MNDLAPVTYSPKYLYTETAEPIDANEAHPWDTDRFPCIDAIHHYFVRHPESEPECADDDGDLHPDKTKAETLLQLITGQFDNDYGAERVEDHAYIDIEPCWKRLRNSAEFIAGGFTHDCINYLKINLPYKLPNVVCLDAADYQTKATFNVEQTGFNALLLLADNTKAVIEAGIATDYDHDVRGAIKFINAQPTDIVDPPCDSKDDVRMQPSKWLVESRYLADALIHIPEFRKNFNTVVIYNAHRYILSGDLNVTKIYRLMAKLGRVNTKIIFVG